VHGRDAVLGGEPARPRRIARRDCATVTAAEARAGRTSAIGPIRAAPSTPTRNVWGTGSESSVKCKRTFLASASIE
jgi:hypothetical protein